MSLLRNIQQRVSRFFQAEKRSSTDGPFSALLSPMTKSGADVNLDSSLTLSSVYSCVTLISDAISSLPISIIEKSGSTRSSINHPVLRLFEDRPFEFWTTSEWMEHMTSVAYLRGYSVAYIQRDQSGMPISLVPLQPEKVREYQWNDSKKMEPTGFYYVQGIPEPVSHEDLIIFSNFQRKSTISLHRESLGQEMATKDYGSKFFGSGANVSGVLSTETPLKADQLDLLEKSWKKARAGMQNSHSTAVLPIAMKYQKITIPPNDSQFIETRNFQRADIASIFRVPLSLIQADGGAKFNNLSQYDIQFVKYTLTPFLKRCEEELNYKLLRSDERFTATGTRSFKYNVDGLLRGDHKSRSEYYQTMRRNGVYSINEIREKENMNPIDGGDAHLIQVNELPVDKAEAYGDKLVQIESKNGE